MFKTSRGELVRHAVPIVMCLLAFLSKSSNGARSPRPEDHQLLKNVLAILSPAIVVRDTVMSGSVHRIAGSDDEIGTAVLKTAGGVSRMELSLPSGQQIEIRNQLLSPPVGHRSGPERRAVAIAHHNLLSEASWFSPINAISHVLARPSLTVLNLGVEDFDSQQVQHIEIFEKSQDSSSNSALLEHLTQFDLYLSVSTLLPMAMSFNSHADDDAALDIPTTIRFSDYRIVNGVQIPFRVQKFINNGLVLDFQFDSVIVNSELSASDFDVQVREQ